MNRTISSTSLRQLVLDVFGRLGVPPEDAATVAGILCEASLSGYDSHGVVRVAMYASDLRKGRTRPRGELKLLRESAGSAHLDAGFSLGPLACVRAFEIAAEKARASGCGCVTILNCTDVARLGSYVGEPARQGMVALMMVNDAGGNPAVAPLGGSAPFFSTNPVAAGIPWQPGNPIVMDFSTSVAAAGKVKMAARSGEPTPEGWLIDAGGEPTRDPADFSIDGSRGALLPLGGPAAAHKGFALNMLVDVLAGVLSGAGASTGLQPQEDHNVNGVFALVVDPGHFVSRAVFEGAVEQLVAGLKASAKAPGFDEILVPGERSHRERRRREREGIPLDPETSAELERLLEELGLPDRYD